MAARISTRTLGLVALLLLVVTVLAMGVGVFLLRQPAMDPVPVPSVSQA